MIKRKCMSKKRCYICKRVFIRRKRKQIILEKQSLYREINIFH